MSLRISYFGTSGIKWAISDSLGLRKSSKPSEMKKNTPSSTTSLLFSLKKMHKFDRINGFLSDFIPWALSTVSLHGKISQNFKIKFRDLPSIKHIKNPYITILYSKNKVLQSQIEKYIKTSENQDLNDFLTAHNWQK